MVTTPPELPTKRPQKDPTSHLSFNLKLTEDEKKAKENVELPYTFHLTQQNPLQKKIILFGEEQEGEEEDEEDPDADLDI